MEDEPKRITMPVANIPPDKVPAVTLEMIIKLQASVNALADVFCALVTEMARSKGVDDLGDDEYYQSYLDTIQEQIPIVCFDLHEQYPLKYDLDEDNGSASRGKD